MDEKRDKLLLDDLGQVAGGGEPWSREEVEREIEIAKRDVEHYTDLLAGNLGVYPADRERAEGALAHYTARLEFFEKCLQTI